VKPPGSPVARQADSTSCALTAHGMVAADDGSIGILRQTLLPALGMALPSAFLKHADEQTVVGLAAIVDAIGSGKLATSTFTDWGVVAAPRFFGRASLAMALARFSVEGAWGVSPHLIPHRSQHSLSGTISQALNIHGPNLGVGGGHASAAEAVFIALGMISMDRLPGLWVILTGWDPEPYLAPPYMAPRQSSGIPQGSVCKGIALALQAGSKRSSDPILRLSQGGSNTENGKAGSQKPSAFTIESLWQCISGPQDAPVTWALGNGAMIELGAVSMARCSA
jgi:hypothetical protein